MDRDEACSRLLNRSLNDWEASFVESIQNWDGDLTDRQAEVLAGLVRRLLHEPCDPEDVR